MVDWGFRVENSIANKYAKSLYDVSVSIGIEKGIADQLKILKDFILSMANYEKNLKKYSLISQYGEVFISQIKDELKLSKEVGNFLTLLLKNKRLPLIVEMCDAYFSLVSAVKGRKVFFITHATDFLSSDKKHLTDALHKIFGGKIEYVSRRDPSLIGGIKIQFRSKILDYSVKSKLTRLQSAIRGSSYEN
ncbi:MAG: ATP synthase F1 subunit delta [Holosporaceae bacterium]|jgi:F-type H+-transporting ATPase subunit delta|nr:ATP synthase F1 subunit delta [Holosporaceae bacterium]